MEEARRVILREVLSDFQKQGLGANDLNAPYEGPTTLQLEQACTANGISKVDYDLALKELEDEKLIGTGPMELSPNIHIPGVVVVPFFFSKKEYAYLKKNGYKTATKSSSQRSTKLGSSTVFNGDQIINYGHAGAIGRQSTGTINHQQQWAATANQIDLSQVVGELQTLRAELMKMAKTPADFQKLGLIAEAEEYAGKQDGPKVMEVLSKSGKWLFDFATAVGTDITAKLIAKATGLEP